MRTKKYMGGTLKTGILMWLFLSVYTVGAQQWRVEKADKAFEQYDYSHAIALYNSLPDGKKDAHVFRNLAEAYYVMGNVDKAVENYEKLMEQGDYRADDIYRYAYLLRRKGDYEQSNVWMEKYARQRPDDSRVKAFLEDETYYKELQSPAPGVRVKNTSVNGEYADFGPAYYGDSAIVFASSRGFGKIWGGNDQRFLNLFLSRISGDDDLSGMDPFNADINKKFHDGPATFDASGQMMIVTRNIYGEKVGDNKLWLYESHKQKDGSWSEPVALPFNSKDYSCGHGALTADGKTLYFASDMPGSKGETDIYKVTKNGDEWGTPQRLGDAVNTEGKEMFPFVDKDGKYLFFASDGWPGLGGLDVFVVKLDENGNVASDKAVNLGAPINGNGDDFALVYNKDKFNGYFSSNREGGKGDDDIYGYTGLKDFQKKLAAYPLTGKIYDTKTGEPLVADMEVLMDGKPFKRIHVGPDGKYQLKVKPGHEYTFKIVKDGYLPYETTISTEGMEGALPKDIGLKRKSVDICSYKVQPLYYDLDKYFIRDNDKSKLQEVIDLMNKYPQIKVIVASHTDSRATKAYNMRLSKNRTMSAIKYLTDHGISADRLIAKWYGESQPVNECVDGVECSEAQHQLNRRTEFKIVDCDKAGE